MLLIKGDMEVKINSLEFDHTEVTTVSDKTPRYEIIQTIVKFTVYFDNDLQLAGEHKFEGEFTRVHIIKGMVIATLTPNATD
jgi:hypothetical protein